MYKHILLFDIKTPDTLISLCVLMVAKLVGGIGYAYIVRKDIGSNYYNCSRYYKEEKYNSGSCLVYLAFRLFKSLCPKPLKLCFFLGSLLCCILCGFLCLIICSLFLGFFCLFLLVCLCCRLLIFFLLGSLSFLFFLCSLLLFRSRNCCNLFFSKRNVGKKLLKNN